tara:strand:+ start:3619 stop:4959 length:1341 start_codon:yes stop_codon:yes gene_type:complete
MDSLGINSAMAQGNALITQTEEARAERSDRIRRVQDQNAKDKNAATDKIASDRNTFLAMDGLSGGETLYKLATSGAETLQDYRLAQGKMDFLGRQLKRSLAGDFARSVDNATGNAISGIVNNYGVDQSAPLKKYAPGELQLRAGRRFDATADSSRALGPQTQAEQRIAEQNQQMALSEFNNVAEASEPVPDRTARLNRVAIADGQIERGGAVTVADPSTLPDTPQQINLQDSDVRFVAHGNQPTTNPALGEQRTFNNTTAQGVTDIEDRAPTTAPKPAAGSLEEAVQDVRGKISGVTSKIEAAQKFAANPLVKGGMKVVGNIQGGEDIYDLFENRNKFTDKGQAGGGFHEGAHILSSLGTISDVAGIFLPGAEELGAALNMTGEILDSIGDHEKDVANASRVFTNASNNLATASKPVGISEGLQTAGLIAGASTHLGTTGTGVATF